MARLGVLVGLLLAAMLTGCSLNAWQSELSQSLEAWQQLKTENGVYYRYETDFISWTGFRSTTTLTVQNERVVARAYTSSYENDAGEPVEESWLEEGEAVGSHDSGADAVTIDALYTTCRTEILTKNTLDNELYLDFHEGGVLETCTYRPLDCMDDCLFGVSIDRLEFLPNKD
jgi:hypothetical protein